MGSWSGKTLSPGALLAVLYFSSCLIFPPVSTFPRPHYLPLGVRGWGKSILVRVSEGSSYRESTVCSRPVIAKDN